MNRLAVPVRFEAIQFAPEDFPERPVALCFRTDASELHVHLSVDDYEDLVQAATDGLDAIRKHGQG